MAEQRNERRFFSQNGEDCLLWQFFDHKPAGFFVEVGAFDGIHLSNTHSFEQQGWTGICIEPHPVYFERCQQSRPGSICLHAACVADERQQQVEFYAEKIGLLSGVGVDARREKDVQSRYNGRNLPFEGFARVSVPATTLNTILTSHLPVGVHIDFVSIDVEGTEIDVLRGFNLRRFRPRVLMVEALGKANTAALTAYLIRRGYLFARRTAQNVYFVRTYRDADKLRHLTVDCTIERTLHPLGESYTAAPYLVDNRHVHHDPVPDTRSYRIKRALGRALPRRFR